MNPCRMSAFFSDASSLPAPLRYPLGFFSLGEQLERECFVERIVRLMRHSGGDERGHSGVLLDVGSFVRDRDLRKNGSAELRVAITGIQRSNCFHHVEASVLCVESPSCAETCTATSGLSGAGAS